MDKEEINQRLNVIEHVMSQILSEVVMLRSVVHSMEPQEEIEEEAEKELTDVEIKQAYIDGEITGFIGMGKRIEALIEMKEK
jgi:signal transduction histidine kinase